MLDLMNKTEAETTLPLVEMPTKRDLITEELRTNPTRSDREIARVVGCDHKTVGAARERMGIASPLGNSPPTATERRHMLVEGCKDFDKHYPPGPSEVATAEEAVDTAIAHGKISTAGAGDLAAARHDMTVQAAVDQVHGTVARMREERQAQADAAGQKNQERTLLIPRKEVTIQHDDEMGEWIIRQRNWPDDDGVITLNDEDIHPFIDILTDHLGYGRMP